MRAVPSVGAPSRSGVHVCTCVCLCVFPVCLGGGVRPSGASRRCASVSFVPMCVSVYCVCVWVSRLQDSRPSPGRPSKGPGSLSSAALEQGVQSFGQNPSPEATNRSQVSMGSPALATSP